VTLKRRAESRHGGCLAGVEGLPVLRAFNGLRESGAIAHPHIILGNPGDCPTAPARKLRVRVCDLGGRETLAFLF
jgi:hypothetical protein